MIAKHTVFIDQSAKQLNPQEFRRAYHLADGLSLIVIQIGLDSEMTGDQVCDSVLEMFSDTSLITNNKRLLINLADELRKASVKARRTECVIESEAPEGQNLFSAATVKMLFFEKAARQAFFIVAIQFSHSDGTVQGVQYGYPGWSPTAEV